MQQKQTPILEAVHIHKWYGEEQAKKVILKDINIQIHKNEFIAIIGPSGSGKSTLLRLFAGLIEPSNGKILSMDKPLIETNENVAIVFQNFALYPWLTVEQNVGIGLTTSTVPKTERQKRVADSMRLIGLHGFEHAYPKEISGGMKQRVGFARALVMQPTILMMDEPFSALDILTAETLRHELFSLWIHKKIPTQTILMVTHSIEEAVSMADTICILSNNPGEVRLVLPGLSVEDRIEKGHTYTKLINTIYQIMTNPQKNLKKLVEGLEKEVTIEEESPYQVLPEFTISKLKGLIRTVHTNGGKIPLHTIGNKLTITELLPLIELIGILGFGGIEEDALILTHRGEKYITSPIEEEKKLFREQILANVSLIQFMVKELEENDAHIISQKKVLSHLAKFFSTTDALLQIKSVIIMGSYAELFTYNHSTKVFNATQYTH